MAERVLPPRIPVDASGLRVGMRVDTTLYADDGTLLLNKGQRIETPLMLTILLERGALFTDELSSREVTRSVMSGFEAATRADAPLKDLDKFALQAKPIGSPSPRDDERPVLPLHEAWSELEAGVRTLLASLAMGGDIARDALKRLDALTGRMTSLMTLDRESSLFLLLSRAVSGFTGYSAQHALVCAVLAQDSAHRLPISAAETECLIRAVITMNVSVRQLQDQLAMQKSPLTQEQLIAIDRHPHDSVKLLEEAGVTDPLWLSVIGLHHEALPHCSAINDRPTVEKLTQVLQVIDRYTAALSPRGSRSGQEPRQATRSAVRSLGGSEHDEVGLDLMQNLGLYPPGTFVRLVGGEVAVVLRRGPRPQQPWVAPVINKAGEPILNPRMLSTEGPDSAVLSGLPGSDIKVRLNEPALLRVLRDTRLNGGRA